MHQEMSLSWLCPGSRSTLWDLWEAPWLRAQPWSGTRPPCCPPSQAWGTSNGGRADTEVRRFVPCQCSPGLCCHSKGLLELRKMRVLGWLIWPLAQCQPSLWDQHRDSHGSVDPSAQERALYNRRQTSPLISQQTPSSITQHLSSKAGFFFSWLSAHMYIIFFIPVSAFLHSPRKKTNLKAQRVPCRPRAGVPRGRGTRWSQQPARPSPPCLLT